MDSKPKCVVSYRELMEKMETLVSQGSEETR